MGAITHPEDLRGDDFTSVGLTRNPSLLPENFSTQHFVETGRLLQKKKKSGFAKVTFSASRKHFVKKLPNHSAGNVLFAISPQGWSAGVLKCYYSPGNCESACPHPQQILVGRALKSLETQQLLPCGVSINPFTLISGETQRLVNFASFFCFPIVINSRGYLMSIHP